MSDILFHYCSLDSFYHIIKDSSLWLSDVSKSNDSQECILCRDKIDSAIRNYLKSNEDDLENWKTGSLFRMKLNYDFHTYCACFSEKRDDLDLWREYANHGEGMSIGFNKALLLELKKFHKYWGEVGPVKYGNSEQERYINTIIKDILKRMEYKGAGHVSLELHTNYRLKFPFIKNQSFRDEKEWRIVVCSPIVQNKMPTFKNFQLSKIKYRVADEKLISYIEMNFEKIKKELIKEIWIGSKAKVEIKEVIDFLNMCGYYEGDNDDEDVMFNSKEPIEIHKSESSYT